MYAVAAFAFSYALIPQIIKGYKNKHQDIALQSSIITSIALYVLAFTSVTLELYYYASMNFLAAVLWSTLLVQRLIYSKNVVKIKKS